MYRPDISYHFPLLCVLVVEESNVVRALGALLEYNTRRRRPELFVYI